MSSTAIARVHYFDRQYLRREDFEDEQLYHLDAHRRHLVGQHVWGIVSGLEPVAGEDGLFVEPGVAVDGYGRQLVLTARQAVPTDAFDDKDRDELDLWLVYQRLESDEPAPGYGPCGAGAAASLNTRLLESPLVRWTAADPALDPRQPKGVPEGDLDPGQLPRDLDVLGWPVFLGRFLRDASDPRNPVYAASLTGRPYAGLVGAAIHVPRQRDEARVVLGGDEPDGPVFEVRLPGGQESALEIDPQGALTARGPMNVYGDLEIRAGALEIPVPEPDASAAAALAQPAPGPSPGPVQVTARPWRIYRHREEGSPGDAATGTADVGATEELRVEMGPDDGRVVVGVFSAEEKSFKPCLTVDADCTVTVHGDLVIEGRIEERGALVTAGFTPQARQVLLTNFLSGFSSTTFLEQAVQGLAESPALAARFADRLRAASPQAAETLGRELAGDETESPGSGE